MASAPGNTLLPSAMRPRVENVSAEEPLRIEEEQARQPTDTPTPGKILVVELQARAQELEQNNAELALQLEGVRGLSQRVLQLHDEERRHMARDLHDNAGQTLALLAMKLSMLADHAQQLDANLASEVEENRLLVRQLVKEVRATNYLLHPPLLDEIGLTAALDWYVQDLALRNGLNIELRIAPEFGRLPIALETAIFRVVQESLANIQPPFRE